MSTNSVCYIIIVPPGEGLSFYKITEKSGITASAMLDKVCAGRGILYPSSRKQPLDKNAMLVEGEHYFIMLTATPILDGMLLKIGDAVDSVSEALGHMRQYLLCYSERRVILSEEETGLMSAEND